MTMSQVRKGYREFKFSWKTAIHFIYFILLIYFAGYFLSQCKTTYYFPIKEVKIAGVQHLNHNEVQRLLTPLVSKGFFAINVEHIKESLAQFSWVADVSVRRLWPNQILIQVVEKSPLALWNEGKLLSTSGQLFSPPPETYPADLPQFLGPEGTQLKMMENYAKISAILAPLHFTIKRFEFTRGQTWIFLLNNGIKLNVGHKDVLTRVNDFVKVYPKIIGNRASEVEGVDLRYSNGLAVRWKTTV
ncbi:MAG: ftsQ [Gammaproteobacteria bacterium]|jgi:cell division protein FtsQ|nr:ftsQ [Gammaproteobacteria bacterium]